MKKLNKKSYAQIGQDVLALELFFYSPAKDMTFLDIGAFDGIGFSNTRSLFEQGWSGICVEPVMKNYQKLESLYWGTSVITVRAAATDYDGEIELNVATIPWAKDWGSDVSSSSEDAMEHWPDYNWSKETVPAMTVNTIMEKNNITHVDFVSIDVEGHEMSVLHGFNLQKYNPLLLVVEYSSTEEQNELIHYMKRQGYASWVDNGQDIFFVQEPILKNWKVFIYGCYQQLKFSKPAQYITRVIKQLAP